MYHKYTLFRNEKEEVLTSVSKIVSTVTGKDLSMIPQDVLAKARDRGIAIHLDVSEKKYQTPEGQWVRDNLPSGEIFSETPFYAEVAGFTYAGTIDLYSKEAGELDDIKSQAAPDILGWTIQANLYRQFNLKLETLAVLWVPKTGSFKRIPLQVLSQDQMREIIEAFQAGRVLPADWLQERKPEASPLELVVYTRTIGELVTNAETILATVKEKITHYTIENYGPDRIAEAKRDKAELNTTAKTLNDKRLELEREFMKPFLPFKDLIDESCKLIKTASSKIDELVKESEQKEKDDKKKLIVDFFASLDCKLFELDKIFNPAWLNKTAKIKDVQDEIKTKIEKTKADLLVLDRINEPDAKAHYLGTLNLESALAEADRIKANRERLAKIEEAKAEPVAEPVADIAPKLPHEEASENVRPDFEPVPTMKTKLEERTIRVRCTMEKLLALQEFLRSGGYEFEKA